MARASLLPLDGIKKSGVCIHCVTQLANRKRTIERPDSARSTRIVVAATPVPNGFSTAADVVAAGRRHSNFRALLLLVQEQFDHLGDPSGPLVGASLGGVDPTKECLPIELRQSVKEPSSDGFGIERSPDVVGEVFTLRALRREHDLDRVARSDTTISPPRGTQYNPEADTKGFDGGPDVHSVHGAADPVV